ncbi:MAG: hypothetical protein Aurels2KO_25330 [Aureliella sp.]
MAEPITQLGKALAARLSTELGATVERRYAPYLDAAELEDAKWLLVPAADDVPKQMRGIADSELAVDVALQQALPEKENRDDPSISIEWVDSRIEDMGRLKALFHPGGVMRDVFLAGSEFKRFETLALFRPDLLIEHRIFTGVVRLVYVHELNDEG